MQQKQEQEQEASKVTVEITMPPNDTNTFRVCIGGEGIIEINRDRIRSRKQHISSKAFTKP